MNKMFIVLLFQSYTDVDECKHPDDNDCDKICENTIGSYTCSCPRWFHGDGRRDGEGCIRDYQFLIKTTVGK